MKTIIIIAALVAFVAVVLLARAAADKDKAASSNVTHVNGAEAAKWVAEKKGVVLDVRTPSEFAEGRIAGAKLVDSSSADFRKKLEALDKTQTYLVYCRSGSRSTRALKVFNELGFKSIVHLDGGVIAWIRAKQPLEK